MKRTWATFSLQTSCSLQNSTLLRKICRIRAVNTSAHLPFPLPACCQRLTDLFHLSVVLHVPVYLGLSHEDWNVAVDVANTVKCDLPLPFSPSPLPPLIHPLPPLSSPSLPTPPTHSLFSPSSLLSPYPPSSPHSLPPSLPSLLQCVIVLLHPSFDLFIIMRLLCLLYLLRQATQLVRVSASHLLQLTESLQTHNTKCSVHAASVWCILDSPCVQPQPYLLGGSLLSDLCVEELV